MKPDTGERPAPAAEAASKDGGLDEIARRVDRITAENQALFSQLLDDERRFRRLAKGVWQVQEDERRRLALELHDGIGQTLTALKNQLQRLEQRADGEMAEALADLAELAGSALNDTRELSRLLRPPVLDDLGLVAALQWLKRTLGQRTGLTVDLLVQGIEDERLDPEIETLIFRVVQEALTNIVKHAGVSEAAVTLQRSAGLLAVSVADQGKGFDADARMRAGGSNESAGLRGIRDRIELFGGRLSIRSRDGGGTRLEMRVPVPENAREGGTAP